MLLHIAWKFSLVGLPVCQLCHMYVLTLNWINNNLNNFRWLKKMAEYSNHTKIRYLQKYTPILTPCIKCTYHLNFWGRRRRKRQLEALKSQCQLVPLFSVRFLWFCNQHPSYLDLSWCIVLYFANLNFFIFAILSTPFIYHYQLQSRSHFF